MKVSRRILVAAALATAWAAVPHPAQAATPSDFSGVWTGVDVLDGSNLVLGVSPRLQVVLYDDAASVCFGEPAVATGKGRIVGDELRIRRFRVDCLGTSPDLTVPYAVEYDATSGDLVETVPGDVQTYQRLI